MASQFFRPTRRQFLLYAGAGPCLTSLAAPRLLNAKIGSSMDNIYAELGVRTLINGRGVATFYSGTLMPPEVHEAMERASEHYIEIIELQKAVGDRLAHYAGTEAAMVCSGSAACIAQATAGCIAGTDPDKIARLPDTSGMKNEVIITQRSVWDRCIALPGAKLVLVQSLKEMESAVNPNTAMVEMEYGDERLIKTRDAIDLCKKHRVPFLLDAAAACPPLERLKTIAGMGPDLFCVSGGKGLFGPQCSGILFGRKSLIEAALRNGSPYEGSICRPMKVGKEEIIGVLAAVEWSSKRDYAADCKIWRSRLQYIVDELSVVPGVHAQIYIRTIGNEVPYLALNWDEKKLGLTGQQCIDALRAGNPQIAATGGALREVVQESAAPPFKEIPHPGEPERLLAFASNTLRDGEEKVIARRLKEVLGPAAQHARS
jgi:L-seryl-tRNA(Ser) seleniumtransferase